MTAEATAPDVVVDLAGLRAYCRDILAAAGLPVDVADLVADSMTDAEARDIRSHGVYRTRIYAERVRAGLVDRDAVPTIETDTADGVLVDAHNAIGHLGARTGVDLAIERAAAATSCTVGVRNSNHCGTLAYFVRRATAAGLILLAATNAPPTMTFFGGRTRAVGTNPLAIGVPRAGRNPVVLDIATSATARGKIIMAEHLGKSIPPGWAVDVRGHETTDATEALRGSVLPFAGPKGSGIAMMIDLLCGELLAGVSGEGIGDMYDDWTRPQQVGHLFIAINPATFAGDAFGSRVASFTDRVHSLPASDGQGRGSADKGSADKGSPERGNADGVLLPGEIEDDARRKAEVDGLTLPATVAAELTATAREVGVTEPLPYV